MLTPNILSAFGEQTAKMALVDGVETLTAARHVDATQTEVAGIVHAVDESTFLANTETLTEEAFGYELNH